MLFEIKRGKNMANAKGSNNIMDRTSLQNVLGINLQKVVKTILQAYKR